MCVADTQVVLLSQVLAAEVNIGYEDMLNTQVCGCWRGRESWARVSGACGASRLVARRWWQRPSRAPWCVACACAARRSPSAQAPPHHTHHAPRTRHTQVLSLNGTKLLSLAQLVRMVDECSEPYLNFTLDYDQKV
jgi:hypothetical protein